MNESEAILQARGLCAGYDGIPAVRNLDLAVRPGEVIVMLGANGAGKTTALLTLAGVLKPTAGQVWQHGRLARGPLHRRVREGLALVTDDRTVFMGLTVAENLRLGPGAPARALQLFPELGPHLRRRVGLLSGGQQQMVTLGRALAAEPDLLMIDELSVGLAPVVVDRLFSEVRAAADRGVAVLLVEQFARQALAMADRAYLLRRGEVVLTGDASSLQDRFEEVERAYLSESA